MDMTLDYNIELFPLRANQSFAMALASSLARGPGQTADGEDEKDKDVWRPDGKGRRGLEEDYDYVMYGKVCAPYATFRINLACAPIPAEQHKNSY
jgi:DNA-directed RNA polymerase I, II, and III subunit RPABC3